jgi:pimeloyl-ACP methyl ester carboxylesterase
MAYFQHGNMQMYYEDVGRGEPIIANHGLSENTAYWNDTGVTAKLTERYRFIPYDMRGHGQTIIEGEPYGYDADTMAADIDALADHLGLDRFHLLAHATGGMVTARYAMTRSERLLSLLLTDTGSATQPVMPGMENMTQEEIEQARETARQAAQQAPPVETLTPEERKARWRENPGPFTFSVIGRPDEDKLWQIMDGFFRRHLSFQALAEFRASFYTDPDPRVEGLRNIKCPTLILLGEHDIVFIKPSEIMAKEIPDNRHIVLPGIGHMTAVEDPDRTIKELLDFLDSVSQKGK